ncbi:serine/threonine protein kinase [Hyalangium rubrum]|uniref:Serine/threonine-protein kinase n=1 Tax=Hyalangium rubrum TaxID=3103134 RepID=A0ABU5H162_9BACT|nr:serine/threonine-protein kinase [Hyalangium sp. s54d21]MDY7227193.1 serine/threonine-protein kinase [Hyalangium sp. s54d21]
MGTKRPLQEVDPLSLPVGMRVGPWRIEGWGGRGAYGTLYRVEHEGHDVSGPFALKLAIHPGDERFAREAWLLSHIHSAHVPQLHAQGVWEHPSGAFPYLVMEWVEGEPLYEWASRRSPSSRQVLQLLAQVARALEATHAAGGVHRDVKGSNVLVRPGDNRAFLTDFGAGHYRGAATLTWRLLPPGTPAYRSPEARAFLHAFLRHPTAHYPASACDDLFALGVTAWRLVTDEYPPTDEEGTEVWREAGPGPRLPRALNPRVSPELETLILRLLDMAPVERFGGRAVVAAEALEQAVRSAGPEADRPLFCWGNEPNPRWRSPERVQRVVEQDVAAREGLALRETEARRRAAAYREQARSRLLAPTWGAELAVALLGLLLAGLTVAWLHRGQDMAPVASNRSSQEDGSVAVGDSVTPASALATMLTDTKVPAVGLPLPANPFPGQRRPPCNKYGEVELRGGCWYALRDAQSPCREDAYDWKGDCYLPSFPPRRQPTAHPP